ncbi:MAG: DUF4124 domain-containing protein [Gammaproteobacteria bacterium]|nr:DUF4124 domain-containing protein [Gammaproteobacteria bacterium]MBV9620932.1 DUF4124 domain-containing protein [Gammaproteobacteria bacterium]
MLRFLPLLLVLGACGVARADVYRWVDEHGEPHYSDQWVPGSQVIKTTRTRAGTDSPGRAAEQKNLMASSRNISGQLEDESNARAVQQDMARVREAQCRAAQDRYLKAIESRRVYKESKDGDRQYLSDDEADAYREVARKDVQVRCGSAPKFDANTPIPEPKPIEPQPIPEPKVNPALATSN